MSSQTETVPTDRNQCPQIERCEEFTGASCPFRVTGCWPRFPLPLGLCLHRPKLSPQTETHVHKLSGAENFLGLHAPSGSLVAGPGFPTLFFSRSGLDGFCGGNQRSSPRSVSSQTEKVLTDRNCSCRPKLFLQTETVLTNRNPCPQIERCEEFTGASCPFRVIGCWPRFPYPIFLSVRCRWILRGKIDS